MIQEMVWFLQANWDLLVATVLAFLAFLELAVRLTPTKTDDGAVERIGIIVKKVFDLLKVPNNVKGEGNVNKKDAA